MAAEILDHPVRWLVALCGVLLVAEFRVEHQPYVRGEGLSRSGLDMRESNEGERSADGGCERLDGAVDDVDRGGAAVRASGNA